MDESTGTDFNFFFSVILLHPRLNVLKLAN
jgi:hypothetical protein